MVVKAVRPSSRQTVKPSDRQAVRPPSRQTVKPSDRQTVKPSDPLIDPSDNPQAMCNHPRTYHH